MRRGGGGGNATAGEAEETSPPRAPRARSEASKILGELSEVWDTWLPPKAVDSFRRGEWRSRGDSDGLSGGLHMPLTGRGKEGVKEGASLVHFYTETGKEDGERERERERE